MSSVNLYELDRNEYHLWCYIYVNLQIWIQCYVRIFVILCKNIKIYYKGRSGQKQLQKSTNVSGIEDLKNFKKRWFVCTVQKGKIVYFKEKFLSKNVSILKEMFQSVVFGNWAFPAFAFSRQRNLKNPQAKFSFLNSPSTSIVPGKGSGEVSTRDRNVDEGVDQVGENATEIRAKPSRKKKKNRGMAGVKTLRSCAAMSSEGRRRF